MLNGNCEDNVQEYALEHSFLIVLIIMRVVFDGYND